MKFTPAASSQSDVESIATVYRTIIHRRRPRIPEPGSYHTSKLTKPYLHFVMAEILKHVLTGLFILVVVFQFKNWWKWRTFKKWAAQNGCGETPEVENHFPGGLERLFKIFLADGGMTSSSSCSNIYP